MIEILIDYAISNKIILDGNLYNGDIYNIFKLYPFENINVFIVNNPGSYTGIRKSLILSIVAQYTTRIQIYSIDILEYFKTFNSNVACIVGKHIWISSDNINNVQPLTKEISSKIYICNQIIPNYIQDYCIIDISIDKLWSLRNQIFIKTNDIIYPKYLDQFS